MDKYNLFFIEKENLHYQNPIIVALEIYNTVTIELQSDQRGQTQ